MNKSKTNLFYMYVYVYIYMYIYMNMYVYMFLYDFCIYHSSQKRSKISSNSNDL